MAVSLTITLHVQPSNELETYKQSLRARGEKLELVVYDDQASPKEAVPVATKLVEKDKVVGAVSGSYSGSTRAAAGIIQAGNLAGLPALVLPCGFAGNLPVALQLVTAPFAENTLLAVGKEFQARTDWHKRRPAGV